MIRGTCWLTLVGAFAVASGAQAAPNSWAEGSAGLNDGATRDYYNRGALLAWRQFNGDWADQSGADHGDAAFAITTVEDTDTARYIEWDVTALVQSWADDELQNEGFFLRAPAGGGPINFRTKEYGAINERPQLSVTVGGNTTDLVADRDTFTEPSTYQAQGDADRMRVGSNNNALVHFALSEFGGMQIEQATLRLFTYEQFGGDTEVAVFRAKPGRIGPPPPIDAGIANDYEMDMGIDDHPDVLMYDNFEDADWESNWSDLGGNYDVVVTDDALQFEALDGRALRARIPEAENTGLNTSFNFMEEIGEEPEEIYFRYYLRLADDWNQSVAGGKLPGISGTYGEAGWGGRKSDGTNGWSARGLFRKSVPVGNNPLGGFTAIGSYVYHADMEGTYGDDFIWVEGWGEEGYGGVLDTNRWYCVEHYVKMNKPGQNDGIIRGWIGGRLSFEKTDLRFRDVDNLKNEKIWMNLYHGGTDPSPYDQHIYIDHVV
ncbi:MAG TPA: DNRLRE domain-containing protein, partial [Planctomycetaceae bacterium]|nr:DNRLRE domain-containing protein [Planctomycetaceae bacterium]